MSNEMFMEYYFTDTCSIRISLKEDINYAAPNYVWITLSADIIKFLHEKNDSFLTTMLGIVEEEVQRCLLCVFTTLLTEATAMWSFCLFPACRWQCQSEGRLIAITYA